MLDGLFIASLITNCYQGIKDAFTKPIPAENWANKELYHKDLMSGMSAKERMKNVENGKYKLPKEQREEYQKPHRAEDGRIIIENCKLYDEDVERYGAYQAQKWVKQGRYNLTPEELEKERKRIKEHLKELYGLTT